ncbi:MAG: 30S ribosome-binding factor RbfA [Planctomycetes bacterium]|nr:30S ribosome-binding factor RbfA [Planctomycetota bacterium]
MPSRRVLRVASRMQFLISSIIQHELSDPRVGFVTVLRVEPTEDLAEAKVYYSVLGDETVKTRTEAAIEQAGGFIQKTVGQGLETRTTPKLRFILDESRDKQERFDNLIEEALEEDRERRDNT